MFTHAHLTCSCSYKLPSLPEVPGNLCYYCKALTETLAMLQDSPFEAEVYLRPGGSVYKLPVLHVVCEFQETCATVTRI